MKTTSILLTWSCLLLLTASLPAACVRFIPHDSSDGSPSWIFDMGVAFITTNNIDDFLKGDLDVENGSAGGEIYALTASKQLGEFELELGRFTFRPQLELPLTLEIVNENGRDPFLDYNASIMVRWVDFPWNKYVKTSLAMGVGLSYSSKIYLMDKQLHPGSDRSHLKINWPIQLSLAHPNHPDHELLLFILHQSGGNIFDSGGVNSVGFGYRGSF